MKIGYFPCDWKKDLLLHCLSYLVYSLTSRMYASSATYSTFLNWRSARFSSKRMRIWLIIVCIHFSNLRISWVRHSTETALLKVHNDLLMNMDAQRVTLLVLLDLRAAIDTVDHEVLLNDPALGSGVLHCDGLPLTFLIGGNVFPLIKKYQRDLIWRAAFLKGPA